MDYDHPCNTLAEVRRLIDSGNVRINGNAQDSANSDFGWGSKEVLAALGKLNARDFIKSVDHYANPAVRVDHYRKDDLHRHRNVYTHFHIRDGQLVIASFKER